MARVFSALVTILPVPLNFRRALLKESGSRILSSGSGHEGIRRFGEQPVDAVVIDLNDDGAGAGLITGELKRMKPEGPVIPVLAHETRLAPGATKQADAVVAKAEESRVLLRVLSGLVGE